MPEYPVKRIEVPDQLRPFADPTDDEQSPEQVEEELAWWAEMGAKIEAAGSPLPEPPEGPPN